MAVSTSTTPPRSTPGSISISTSYRPNGVTEYEIEGVPDANSTIRMFSKYAKLDFNWNSDAESVIVSVGSDSQDRFGSLTIEAFTPMIKATNRIDIIDSVQSHDVRLSPGGRGPLISNYPRPPASNDKADLIVWDDKADQMAITIRSQTEIRIPRPSGPFSE